MDKHVHEQWLQDYEDWKESGMTLSRWAREHGIKSSTFRNRNAVARSMLDHAEDISCDGSDGSSGTNFVEVVTENRILRNTGGDLVIEASGVHVEVDASVPEWQLRMVLEVLKHA